MTEAVPNRSKDRLPETGAGFFWAEEPFPMLRPKITERPGMRVGAIFSTRLEGASEGPYSSLNLSFVVGDEDARVRKNRKSVAALLGAEGWSAIKQVHGPDVVRSRPVASGGLPETDAQWTDEKNAIGVLSADCALILAISNTKIAVAHAGWRGLVAGVVENTVSAIEADEVFIGPAIGPCCFEVGTEVTAAFTERFPSSVVDHRHVDLWVAACDAAGSAGAQAINACRICTSCHEDLFFSHRRDAGRTGRHGLIARILGT